MLIAWCQMIFENLKLSWRTSFQHAFTEFGCIFREINWVWANHHNNFENVRSKRVSQRGFKKLFFSFLNNIGLLSQNIKTGAKESAEVLS